MKHITDAIEEYEVLHRLPNCYWHIAGEIVIDLDSASVTTATATATAQRIPASDKRLIAEWAKTMITGLRGHHGEYHEAVSLLEVCEGVMNKVHKEILEIDPGCEKNGYSQVCEWLVWQIGKSIN
jgi:hypothetical protein